MQCPKCGHPQADGRLECERCGVIFSKIPANYVRTKAPASPPADASREAPEIDPEERAAGNPAPLAALLALLCIVGAALWWLNKPSGNPLDKASHVNAEKGYALAPPDGWLALSPNNFKELLKPFENRIPKEWRRQMEISGFDVAFVRIPESENDFSPSLNIIAMPLKGRLPELNEAEKDKATQIISDQMRQAIASYQLVGSRLTEVDRLKALELRSTASLRVVTRPSEAIYRNSPGLGIRSVVDVVPEVARELEIKSVQTLVPGRQFGYILSCSFETSDVHDSESLCKTAVSSFRVTDRPARFGSITMGSLNGGLIGAGLYLLWIVFGRLTRRD